ncbi:hypothetical protein FACS1894188_01230 [Clostridia bacterium]|nr:hypothetical protein FACS1894188_01230 [Clostridia bacterium]
MDTPQPEVSKVVACKKFSLRKFAPIALCLLAVFAMNTNVFAGTGTLVDMTWLSTTLTDGLIATVNGAISAVAPVGAKIMFMVIGISLVPRIIYKFV